VLSKADIDAGLLVFTPAQDANGTAYDSFGFSVNDGTVDSDSSYTITVDILPEPVIEVISPEYIDANNDGTIDVIIESGGNVLDNGDGTFTLTTADNSMVTIPVLPEGSTMPTVVVSNLDNSLTVDMNNDGTTTIVPENSQIVDNQDGSLTVITEQGSQITVSGSESSIIVDNGTAVTVDFNGDGIVDFTAPSGSTLAISGTTPSVYLNMYGIHDVAHL
ncbi:hypothetical protein, partial [Facilibium subflavum]|uniref:hypothetical protein n=1 Tax=Facilibium subflavum TaxID=2219058 RepID=UPI0013C30DE6